MKERVGVESFKNLMVQTSLVALLLSVIGHTSSLVGFSFIYCIWGKTIIAAMPLANCSTNSLLINLIILHLSCQNCELYHLHVISVTVADFCGLIKQASKVITSGVFFVLLLGFFSLFFFLVFSFQTLIFDPSFCYGTWAQELALPQHSQTDLLYLVWGATSAPSRHTTVRASWALLTHLSTPWVSHVTGQIASSIMCLL